MVCAYVLIPLVQKIKDIAVIICQEILQYFPKN